MSKRGLEFEQRVTANRAAAYLDELAKGLRAGRLKVSAGDRRVCLHPSKTVELELEVSASDEKQKLSLEMRWTVSEVLARAAQTREPEPAPTVEAEPAGGLLDLQQPPTEGYCVKCRARREIVDPTPLTLSNGRSAIQGTCPVCGTRVTRMVKGGGKASPG